MTIGLPTLVIGLAQEQCDKIKNLLLVILAASWICQLVSLYSVCKDPWICQNVQHQPLCMMREKRTNHKASTKWLTRMHVDDRVRRCKPVFVHVYTHVCIRMYGYIRMYVSMYACEVCMYARVYIYVCMHMCRYTYVAQHMRMCSLAC